MKSLFFEFLLFFAFLLPFLPISADEISQICLPKSRSIQNNSTLKFKYLRNEALHILKVTSLYKNALYLQKNPADGSLTKEICDKRRKSEMKISPLDSENFLPEVKLDKLPKA